MTRLEIITQFLAKMTRQPERELLTWVHENIEPDVVLKLSKKMSRKEISMLITELDKSPEAFLSQLLGQISGEDAQKIPVQLVISRP